MKADHRAESDQPFLLGEARIEPASNEIIVSGKRRRVRRKLMDALVYLATRSEQLVTRGELLERLWPRRLASDESLTQLMSELRRELGAEGAALQTVSGKGYRLNVATRRPPDAASIAATNAALVASDRRWGFALLLGLLVSGQALMLLFGGGHHH